MELDEYTLNRLEQLAKDATPGPWRWGTGEENDGDWPLQFLVTVEKREVWRFTPGEHEVVVWDGEDYENEEYRANREFIRAASPEVILALIEAVREKA